MDTCTDTSCILGSIHRVSCYTWDTNICKDVTYRQNNKRKVSCYTWDMDMCKGVIYRLNNKCMGIDRSGSTDRPSLGGCSNSGPDGPSQPRRQQRDRPAVAAVSSTLG